MPTQEAITNQQLLLQNYRRTLTIYLQQKATFGSAFVPPHVEAGIQECQDNIYRIKQTLLSWNIPVENLPDDASLDLYSSKKTIHQQQLSISREFGEYEDAFRNPESKYTRFFHIKVDNLDSKEAARNCIVFLESVRNTSTGEKIDYYVEVYWQRFTVPNATILPGLARYFDALMVFHDSPHIPRFKVFSTSDSPKFVPKAEGPGEYQLTYIVCSDNFETIRGVFNLSLGKYLKDIELKQV